MSAAGKRGAAKLLFLNLLVLISCATKKGVDAQLVEAALIPAAEPFSIIEQQDSLVPVWLRAYLEGGDRYVETLGSYTGQNVFVITEKNSELKALLKWSEYFRVEQDFPNAVLKRMHEKLVDESEGHPDYVFGNFYEEFLKKIADASFPEALRADDFWLRLQVERARLAETEDAEGEGLPEFIVETETIEEYCYYIIVTIDRAALADAIIKLFAASESTASAAAETTRQQKAAINRLQSRLFIGW